MPALDASAAPLVPAVSADERPRREDSARVEELELAVRKRVEELGTDVHPELGHLWLDYGDALLELQEGGCGNNKDGEEADNEEDAVEDDEEDDEEDDDLQVAWESLETARRCFEGGANSATLARVHGRLADLLILQGHFEDAVAESRTSVAVLRRAAAAACKEGSGPAPIEVEAEAEALARLAEALSRAEHPDEARATADEAVRLVTGLTKDASGAQRLRLAGIGSRFLAATAVEANAGLRAPDEAAAPARTFEGIRPGTEVSVLPVRRKRPREEEKEEEKEEEEPPLARASAGVVA